MFGFRTWGDDSNQLDDGLPRVKTWQDFARLIEKGLPGAEVARLRDAYLNLRYANGHFDDADAARSGSGGSGSTVVVKGDRWDDAYGPDRSDSRWEKPDFRIYPPIAKRIAGKLSEHLYKRPPTRELADKAVGDLLQEIYIRNGMQALWQEADRLTAVGGFSALQFAADDDPEKPVKIHLWSADQLVPFVNDDDHAKLDAVITLDQVDGRTRATLYTPDKIVRFTTKRGNVVGDQTRQFVLVGEPADNPYRDAEGNGIIPFSFVHWRYPATEFTTDGPGTNIREVNRYILHGLDDTADGVRYLVRPIGVAEGVAEDWEPGAIIRPGMFLNMSAGQVDAGGNGPIPRLSFLTPDSSWVAVVWSHLNNYLDLSLELENIPPSTIRMVLDARSGVSILAEQAPLLGWTEQRRRAFLHYETRAAETCLSVFASSLRAIGRDTKRIEYAAADPGLQILWPRLYVDLPGPERDRADGVRISWGTASLLDIVQEREDCTRDQALAKLQRVKADNDELEALGITAIPAGLGSPNNSGGGSFGQGPGGLALDSNQLDQTGDDAAAPLTGEPVDTNAQADALSQEGG